MLWSLIRTSCRKYESGVNIKDPQFEKQTIDKNNKYRENKFNFGNKLRNLN